MFTDQLQDKIVWKQERKKYSDRSQSGGDNRFGHLLSAPYRCFLTIDSDRTQPEDILHDDDRIIQQHAHSEGYTR